MSSPAQACYVTRPSASGVIMASSFYFAACVSRDLGEHCRHNYRNIFYHGIFTRISKACETSPRKGPVNLDISVLVARPQ
jgi:hypothetical protein